MSIVSFLSELDRVSDALCAHLRRLRGEEQKRAATRASYGVPGIRGEAGAANRPIVAETSGCGRGE